MFNIIIDWKKIKDCTVEEKDDLLKYIEELLVLKDNFNIMAIECFPIFLQNHEDNFAKVAIDIVCQGIIPDIASKILSNLINSSTLSNYEYLKYILFSIFILLLQQGTHSSMDTKRILLSYLGIGYSNYILTENLLP